MSRLLRGLLVLMVWQAIAGADVQLPALVSDHMVLSRGSATAVWGAASPGEAITVTLGARQATTQADANGVWQVRLDLSAVDAGPFDLTVAGRNTVQVRDVLVGAVWLASGQSNMQFALNGDRDSKATIAQSANPQIRHFKIALAASLDPQADCRGRWEVAAPSTAGSFSAVAHHFARRLHAELKAPVGIIDASWGGTGIAGWTSAEALRTVEDDPAAFDARLASAREYPRQLNDYRQAFAQWVQQAGRKDRGGGIDSLPSGAWTDVELPLPRNATPFGSPGAIWFRRQVDVTDRQAGRHSILVLGDIAGFDEVFWDRQSIARTTPEDLPGSPYSRQYLISAAQMTGGTHDLAIRVYGADAAPALLGRVLKLGTTSLAGTWQVQQEYAFDPADVGRAPAPPRAHVHQQAVPGSIFNGMIHPVLPCTIAGVIWYQGEANVARAWWYRTLFRLLIEDWRSRWRQPDLPFYFCQLANHGAKSASLADSLWAELRYAQAQTLELPHTGQAVLIELGEAENVHPWNKQDVGLRLAGIALAKTYGRDVPWSGPTLASSAVEGSRIRIRFHHAEAGLVARPVPERYPVFASRGEDAPLQRNSPESQLEGFAICGSDRQWVWAQARIDGDAVLVRSPQVEAPVAVRYAWQDNPTVNLYNAAGLPAAPFRTDDFKLRTEGLK